MMLLLLGMIISMFAITVSQPGGLADISHLGPRQNINDLTPEELLNYREAFRKAQSHGASSDFVELSSDHGDDRYFCPHGRLTFLPWHRRALHRMEALLGVPIHYWDWTTDDLPAAFSERNYVDPSGRRRTNPLYRSVHRDGSRTSRSRNSGFPTQSLRDQIAIVNQETDFSTFSDFLESAHNTVHGIMGGSMGSVSTAAFDPVFVSHHMFVDRTWWLWQQAHPDAEYPDEAIDDEEDSLGEFSCNELITFFSDWSRGRSASGSRPQAIELHQNHLVMYINNIPPTANSSMLSVNAYDVTLGIAWNLGMKGANWTQHSHRKGALVVTDRYRRLSRLGKSLTDISSNAVIKLTDMSTMSNRTLNDTTLRFEWKAI